MRKWTNVLGNQVLHIYQHVMAYLWGSGEGFLHPFFSSRFFQLKNTFCFIEFNTE